MVKRAQSHADPEIRRLGRILEEQRAHAYESLRPDGAQLDMGLERAMYDKAKTAYGGSGDGKSKFAVNVPEKLDHFQALIAPEYQKRATVMKMIPNTPLDQIQDPKEAKEVAEKILDAQLMAMNSGTFDEDCHPGQWLYEQNTRTIYRTDTALLETAKEGEMQLFKKLAVKISDPKASKNGELKSLLQENFTKIFNVDQTPTGLGEALTKILGSPAFIREQSPQEKLLLLQDGLDRAFFESGKHVPSIKLRPTFERATISLLNLSFVKDKIGTLKYAKKISGFLEMPAAQMRRQALSLVLGCLRATLKKMTGFPSH